MKGGSGPPEDYLGSGFGPRINSEKNIEIYVSSLVPFALPSRSVEAER